MPVTFTHRGVPSRLPRSCRMSSRIGSSVGSVTLSNPFDWWVTTGTLYRDNVSSIWLRCSEGRRGVQLADAQALDQAAAYAADPEVTATLIEAAASSPGQLNHALSRAEQDRDRANRNGRPLEELTAAGVTVIDPPEHGSTATAVHRQTHGGQPLDPAATAAVPGMPPTCTPASTASPWTSCTCAPTPAGTGTATAAPTTNPSPARRGGR